MATLSSLQVAATFPLKFQEKGVYSLTGEYTLTASLSSGDVLRMVKVPDGVTVLGIEIDHPVLTAGAAPLLSVGDGVNLSRFASSHTAVTAGKFILGTTLMSSPVRGFPYTYDLSDNDPNMFDTIDIIVQSGTGTNVGTIKLIAYVTAQHEL